MKIKDHFLTQEEFELIEDPIGILQTTPVPKDLDKYYESESYISHTDSQKNLFDLVYQFAKNINLKHKKTIIKKHKNDGDVLDYGCGVGDFLKYIKTDYTIHGIEPNKNAAKIASNKTGITIHDTTTLSKFQNEKFDVITLWHVLEHIPNLEEISIELKRLLKKDGILIIAVPNHLSYDAHYYKEFWAAYDVPRHLWHFSKSSMKNWWEKFDLEITESIPMKLDSFYVSVLSEKYRNKNIFSFVKGIYRGLLSNIKAKKTDEYSSIIYILKNKTQNKLI